MLQLCQGAELPSEMSLEGLDSLYRLLAGNQNRRILSEEVPDELGVSLVGLSVKLVLPRV